MYIRASLTMSLYDKKVPFLRPVAVSVKYLYAIFNCRNSVRFEITLPCRAS